MKMIIRYNNYRLILCSAIILLGLNHVSAQVNAYEELRVPSNLVSVAEVLQSEYRWKNIDAAGKSKVQTMLEGHEQEALHFAFENVFVVEGGDNIRGRDQNRMCLTIMGLFNKNTYEHYKKIVTSEKVLSGREKTAVVSWGYGVSNPEYFRFVIDTLLEDDGVAPDNVKTAELSMGEALRYCDLVLGLAQSRIEGLRDWSVYGRVVRLVRINHRDEDLAQFKKWWAENKELLVWSEERGSFFVDPAKEKGIGIQNIKDIIGKNGLDHRERIMLRRWAEKVDDSESFCFIVDTLLAEGATIPYGANSRIKEPLRRCDHALFFAQKRIVGTRDWSVHDKITSKVEIAHRDADLALFKKWWAENKANLKWSEEKKKFQINPKQEKGAGILNVKRNRRRE